MKKKPIIIVVVVLIMLLVLYLLLKNGKSSYLNNKSNQLDREADILEMEDENNNEIEESVDGAPDSILKEGSTQNDLTSVDESTNKNGVIENNNSSNSNDKQSNKNTQKSNSNISSSSSKDEKSSNSNNSNKSNNSSSNNESNKNNSGSSNSNTNNELTQQNKDLQNWEKEKKELMSGGYYNDAFSKDELNNILDTLMGYGYAPSYAPQCTKYQTLGEMCGYHIDVFIISSRVNKCIAPTDKSKVVYDDRGFVEYVSWRKNPKISIYKFLTSIGFDCANVNDPYPS